MSTTTSPGTITPPDTFLTLNVSSYGAAVETRINGVREEFVSGGADGSLASSAPINPLVDDGENTVEFWLSPSASGTTDPAAPEFRATLRLYRRLHQRKFGTSILVLDRVPAAPGEVMTGEVECGIPVEARPVYGFRLLLRCVHRWQETYRRGSDLDRRTHDHRDILWEDERRTHGTPDHDLRIVRIPVTFRLPTDRPGSSPFHAEEGIAWELTVTAEFEGLDYRARFVIPVAGPPPPAYRRT